MEAEMQNERERWRAEKEMMMKEQELVEAISNYMEQRVQWKTDFTLYDDVRDPGEVYEALQAEKCMQELTAISYCM
ncbi:hypothetical protein SRHO_G00084730 [Serrasalmus rhombeus]